MNPEQWRNEVKAMLDAIRPVGKGLYCLVVVNGMLKLKPKSWLRKDDHPLIIFSSIDINQGLSSKKWSSIGNVLALRKDLNAEL